MLMHLSQLRMKNPTVFRFPYLAKNDMNAARKIAQRKMQSKTYDWNPKDHIFSPIFKY